MSAHRHQIETLALRARLASPEQAEPLTRLLHGRLLPLLAEALDAQAPADRTRRIERLELRLGRLRLDDPPERWRARIDAALARALGPAGPPAALPAAALELQQFLHFLLHGCLPWQLARPPSGQGLSAWLERLARRQGRRLWQQLQRAPQQGLVLERLSRISPPEGLQALLAARQPALAEGLGRLDEDWLAPLQRGGRIGAYQALRLRQRLRATALRALWGQGGGQPGMAWRQRLFAALRADLEQTLGSGWQALQPTAAPRGAAPDDPLARELFEAVLGRPQAQARPDPGTEAGAAAQRQEPARLALSRLGELLRREGRSGSRQRERARQLLATLGRQPAPGLRAQLQDWLRQRRLRRRCSELLEPEALPALLGLPDGGAGMAWADSLRQTALRLQRQCPAGRRPRLARLQALLMEASLAELAAGRRLPDSHSGWQALWRAAWARWQRSEEQQAEAAPVAPPPATPARQAEASRSRRAPPTALQALARDCQQGRWGWSQRLRLARLLETPRACLRWLRATPELQRWQLLRAQFGRAVEGLRLRLQRLFGLARPDPVPAPSDAAPRQRERLWLRLCRQLFVEGLGLSREALAAPASAPPARAALPAPAPLPAGQPLWVDDAGQVLLAAYAPRLFARFGLLDASGRQWRSEPDRACAVACLQYLVRGDVAASIEDEHRLPLSKLLCGAAPNALLAEAPPLEAERRAELDQLLQALIAHWGALGSTRNEGLRESFLQRPGRLVLDAEAEQAGPDSAASPARWRLKVEPRAFDMLLDRLPWSYGLIRLPWMGGVIHVDWR